MLCVQNGGEAADGTAFCCHPCCRCYEPVVDGAPAGSSGCTRRHQCATASTRWRISSRVPSSRTSTCSSNSLEARGTSTCGSGTTMAPMRPSTSPQGSLCVRRARLTQDGPHHCYRFVAQHAATRRSLRPVDRIGEHPWHCAVVLRSGDQDGV